MSHLPKLRMKMVRRIEDHELGDIYLRACIDGEWKTVAIDSVPYSEVTSWIKDVSDATVIYCAFSEWYDIGGGVKVKENDEHEFILKRDQFIEMQLELVYTVRLYEREGKLVSALFSKPPLGVGMYDGGEFWEIMPLWNIDEKQADIQRFKHEHEMTEEVFRLLGAGEYGQGANQS